MISDPRKSLLILILLEEVEHEIQGKACQNNVVDEHKERSLFDIEGNVKHGGKAGVANDYEDGGIEDCLPLAAHADDEVLCLQALAKGDLLVFLGILVLLGFGVAVSIVIRVTTDILLVEGCGFECFADHLADILHSIE